MATGAEGGALGTGVAVHLPINFHGLSEWKEKNRENDSTLKAKEIRRRPNNTGRGSMQTTCVERNSFKWQKQEQQYGRLLERAEVSEGKGLEMLDEWVKSMQKERNEESHNFIHLTFVK